MHVAISIRKHSITTSRVVPGDLHSTLDILGVSGRLPGASKSEQMDEEARKGAFILMICHNKLQWLLGEMGLLR